MFRSEKCDTNTLKTKITKQNNFIYFVVVFFVFSWTDLYSEETYPNNQQALTCGKKDSLFSDCSHA